MILLFLIVVTAISSYSNTFTSSFHFDDLPNIVERSKIQDLSNFLDLSGTRYVGELSFALNYHFGGLNVFGYHLVNILTHMINGILVWWLVVLTFRTPALETFGAGGPQRDFIAMAAALIFIAHPVQTQAVTYIVQRFTSFSTLFFLLSVVLFVKWRLSSGSRVHLVFYFLSLLSIVLAMKTKEISFTLPFVILLYECSFFRERKKIPFFLIPVLLSLLIIPLMIIGTNKPVADIVGEMREAAQETEAISRGDYLLTQFRVIVTYIRLMFLPVNQNLDYDYPVYQSFFIPNVFLSFLFLLTVIVVAAALLMKSRKTGNGYLRLISFGIFWFFITLSVESSLIPIRDLIFEHRLYLPGAGAAIAFSSAVVYGLEFGQRQFGLKLSSWLAIVLIAAIVPLSIATYQRNQVWKDEVTLWEDAARKSPKKARVHQNLGSNYYKKGWTEKAVREFRTALMIEPDVAEVYNNLGLCYYRQGRFEDAVAQYMIAIKLKPDFAPAYNNLGVFYYRQGRLGEAIGQYREAILLKPGYANAHYNLGLAYLKQGRSAEAKEAFNAALKQNPALSESYSRLDFSVRD